MKTKLRVEQVSPEQDEDILFLGVDDDVLRQQKAPSSLRAKLQERCLTKNNSYRPLLLEPWLHQEFSSDGQCKWWQEPEHPIWTAWCLVAQTEANSANLRRLNANF